MKTFTISALLLSTALATPAFAAEEDTIIVTARKTEERINDVPVSILYLSSKDIEARNAVQVTDLPGFGNRISTPNSSSLLLSMHGQQQSDPHISIDGAVGVYVDGVYVARSYGLNTPLLDVKNVQVLYGPQGTIFGRNAVGGAIIIDSNDPELGRASGEAQLTYGRYNEFQETGIINLPVSDTVAVRVAATKIDRDGYVTNTVTGTKWNNKDEFHGRAKILYSPSTEVRAVLTGEYYTNTAFSDPRFRIVTNGVATNVGNYSTTALTRESPTRVNYGSISGDLEIGNFKVVGGWRKTKSSQRTDIDGDIADTVDFGNYTDIQQYTAEATYTNTFGNLKYLLGAFVFDERGNDDIISSSGNHTSNANWYYYGINKSYGTYANLSYPVGNLTVNAGVRYTHDSKEATTRNLFLNSADVPTSCIISTASFANGCRLNLKSSFNDVSWSAGVDYRLNSNTLVFAKVGTGYRAGGVNKASENSTLARILPEHVTEYSVGVKGDVGPVTYSLTGFYDNITDGQVSAVFYIPTPVSVVKNAANIHTWGGEAEITARIADNFRVRATALLAYPKYVSYIDPSSRLDVSNSRFNLLVKEQFGVDGTYSIGNATLNAAYLWTGRMPHSTLPYASVLSAFSGNTTKANVAYAASETPGAGTLNLRASYDITPNTSVSIWGRNVLNNRYYRYGLMRAPAFNVGTVNDPVTYGVTLTGRF